MKSVLTLILFALVIKVQAQIVTIGKQVWMTENLNVEKFRNGEPIPEAKTIGEWKAYSAANEAAWCFYDNNPINGEKYGRLYNWYAVSDPRGLCPTGWHVPSLEEWSQLTEFLGGVDKAGAKLKSKSGWSTLTFDEDKMNQEGNGTNSSGFNALPGAARHFDGEFHDISTILGVVGFWWSSTPEGYHFAWHFYLCGNGYKAITSFVGCSDGLYVRCLRD
jgi:uncharacterized protein (TIGR02145 family)